MQPASPERRGFPALVALLSLALPLFLNSAFAEKVALNTPSWLRDGVIYEVFPRDFSQAGSFNAVTARLDDLKSLGVDVLWLTPVHPIGEKLHKGTLGSPYAVKDYYAIDSAYGTADDLKRLVSQAHARGMKVLFDLVANHTAWDSVLMTNRDFYKQDANGNVIAPDPGWSDVAGLNYSNRAVQAYMLGVMKYWIDPNTFDFDGFRCDVAFGVPTSFWEQARAELAKIKPDIGMLAEANKPELMVKAFDLDYSWPLLSTVNNVIENGASATSVQACWEQARREFPDGTLHMRMSDDHDESRAVARYGLRGALAASALMFTLDGVPLLYNGMEVGDATESGDPALFEKLPIFWHPKDRPSPGAVYRSLIALRKSGAPFRNDSVTWLRNSDSNNVVTFMRADDKNEFVVVINFSNRAEKASVEAPHAAEFNPVKIDWRSSRRMDRGNWPHAAQFKQVRIDGMPAPNGEALNALHLGAFEWRVYHRHGKDGILAATAK